jgi:hypothetical protein
VLRPRVASLLLVAAATSCSLTSLEGLSSGPARDDAGAESGSDATAEATAPDDAGPDREAPDGGSFCASLSPAPTFCVDFGDARVHSAGAPTSTDFESVHPESTSQPLLDTAVFTSAPASGAFALTPTATRSYLVRTFPVVTPPRIEYAMSLRVDAPADAQFDLMEIRFGAVEATLFLSVDGVSAVMRHSHGIADGGRVSESIPLGKELPRGVWTRVAWVIETGAAPTLSVSFDGTPVLTRKPLATFTASAGVTFVAGCTDSKPVGPTVRVWSDDVVATF